MRGFGALLKGTLAWFRKCSSASPAMVTRTRSSCFPAWGKEVSWLFEVSMKVTTEANQQQPDFLSAVIFRARESFCSLTHGRSPVSKCHKSTSSIQNNYVLVIVSYNSMKRLTPENHRTRSYSVFSSVGRVFNIFL